MQVESKCLRGKADRTRQVCVVVVQVDRGGSAGVIGGRKGTRDQLTTGYR